MSELYLSLIMHPVQFPIICGAYTNTMYNIIANGMDENTAANALGEFFCSPLVNTLYIYGSTESHAEDFFTNLRNILSSEPELTFVESCDQLGPHLPQKRIVRVRHRMDSWPTPYSTHKILSFPIINHVYRPFCRDDFCCYLYCGNSEDGPLDIFRCRNPIGQLCIRKRFSGRRSCGICFWVPMKKRLKEPQPLLTAEDDRFIDEGCVAEPLGVGGQFYRSRFSDVESDGPDSDEEIPSDIDW
ncbi:putative psittacine PAV19 [Psittacine adenovirus 1]|uniref:Putative psittacine PAV19 n=1 Tax=Psittacine adenovirus 1 TaxID=318592 RepID=A0A2Z5E068_9ADEN|nr:putative psittacine PAV19 [Psittacine adenovirus 1]AXB73057.1 putative psittacine PAV19 [Psittacine adenovirus 1]